MIINGTHFASLRSGIVFADESCYLLFGTAMSSR